MRGVFYFVARRLLVAASTVGVATPPPPAHGRADLALSVGPAFAALVFGSASAPGWNRWRGHGARDVLCGLSICSPRSGISGSCRRRGDRQVLGGALLGAFLLALMSQGGAMPLPAGAPLLDIYPLRRLGAIGVAAALVEKAPYLALSAATALLAVIAFQSSAEALTGYQSMGSAREWNDGLQPRVLSLEARWSADLSPLYELPRRVDPLAWGFLFPTLAFVAVTVALVGARRRCPGRWRPGCTRPSSCCAVTGAVAHAGVQIAADRYSYLSGSASPCWRRRARVGSEGSGTASRRPCWRRDPGWRCWSSRGGRPVPGGRARSGTTRRPSGVRAADADPMRRVQHEPGGRNWSPFPHPTRGERARPRACSATPSRSVPDRPLRVSRPRGPWRSSAATRRRRRHFARTWSASRRPQPVPPTGAPPDGAAARTARPSIFPARPDP